jgi:hypothetical protein
VNRFNFIEFLGKTPEQMAKKIGNDAKGLIALSIAMEIIDKAQEGNNFSMLMIIKVTIDIDMSGVSLNHLAQYFYDNYKEKQLLPMLSCIRDDGKLKTIVEEFETKDEAQTISKKHSLKKVLGDD